MSLDLDIVSRYKQGQSAQQIADVFGVSIKTIYRHLIKSGVERRNAKEQNKIRFDSKPLSYNFKDPLLNIEKDLFLAALMLYKGEGAKSGNTVDFVNSDKETLLVFMKFLREICGVQKDKIRIYLYCFSDQDIPKIIDYWSRVLAVQKSQFTQPYIRQTLPNSPKKLSYGVVHIRYNDKKLLEKILHMCEKVLCDLLV